MSEWIALIFLLCLSAFFSGSETALTSLTTARAESLAGEGRPGGKWALHHKRHFNRILVIILIGNNLVNTAAAALATVVATRHFGDLGPGLAVGVITLLLLLFGEITPKALGARFNISLSLLVSGPLHLLGYLLHPLVRLLEWLIHHVQRWTGEQTEPKVTESELITLAEHASQEGSIDEEEHQMIRRIFDFGALLAGDIMVKRRQVFTLDGARTLADALPEILAQSHSHLPLHEGNPEEITKAVYLRDILAALAAGKTDLTLLELGHDPLFVPFNQPVDTLFDILRGNKNHLIIVVDEFGAFLGLFTLEDVLEELVGEIRDDLDTPSVHTVRELPEHDLLVEGGTELRSVEEHLGVSLQGKPNGSVCRWVLDHVHRIPAAGEQFLIDGLEVRVEKASRRRIHELRIGRPQPVAEEPHREEALPA